MPPTVNPRRIPLVAFVAWISISCAPYLSMIVIGQYLPSWSHLDSYWLGKMSSHETVLAHELRSHWPCFLRPLPESCVLLPAQVFDLMSLLAAGARVHAASALDGAAGVHDS